MKIFDKLKNALFEEEYVEVEEKPKKVKDKKKKVEKREAYFDNPEEDEKPVAKRIVPQERKNIDTLDEEDNNILDNVSFRDQDLIETEPEPKIAMVSEEDLVSDDTLPQESFEPVKRRSEVSYEVPQEEYLEEKEEPKLYQNSKKESFYDNYIPHAYGNYEKQREKSKEGFKPSPVISPIYGIVADDSYEVQPRREVRITTPVKSGKMNIDDIRKKAFGQHSEEKYDAIEPESEVLEEKNTLVDLSDDSTTPEVNSITMGDAMEYFEDLGLEYNEDYIDRSKMARVEPVEEIKSGPIKITDNTLVEDDEDENFNALDDRKFTVSEGIEEDLEPLTDEKEVIVTEKVDDQVVEDNDSDNLFDLIDSMYE